MSFDPYHKWLGIPQGERPPHHYALLGIPLFESDDEVISYAADRQMMHLRSLAHGPNGNLSQRLLNEISLAKCCLLDPVERAEYDAQLRQRLPSTEPLPAGQRPGPPPAAALGPVAVTLPAQEPFTLDVPVPTAFHHATAPRIATVRRTRPRRSRIGRWLPWVLPLCAAGGLAAFVWYAKNEFARQGAEPPSRPQPTRNSPQPSGDRVPRGFVPARQLLPRDAPDESGKVRLRPGSISRVADRAGKE